MTTGKEKHAIEEYFIANLVARDSESKRTSNIQLVLKDKNKKNSYFSIKEGYFRTGYTKAQVPLYVGNDLQIFLEIKESLVEHHLDLRGRRITIEQAQALFSEIVCKNTEDANDRPKTYMMVPIGRSIAANNY